MKSKLVILVLGLSAGVVSAQSTSIPIPDGDFESVSASINPPALGVNVTTTGKIGPWSASYYSLVAAGGFIASSNAITQKWPAPPSGTNELQINIPLGVADIAGVSQTLTNKLMADSVYTLTFDVSQGTAVGLVGGASASLMAGTNGTTLSGSYLLTLLNNSSSFQMATLTYKTGNTVPTNDIAISFSLDDVAAVVGSIYLDNFQLSVAPIQVAVTSSFTPGGGSGGNLTLTGTNGAPGATYEILSTTNLLSSATVWTIISTNHFDANGAFSQKIVVDPNEPCRFFRTVVP